MYVRIKIFWRSFVMKKRLLLLGTAVLLVLSLSAFMGCSQDDEDDIPPDTLAASVYGGETMSPNWITISFLDKDPADDKYKAIASFPGGSGSASSTNYWEYTYNPDTGEGDFPDASIGAFTIKNNGKTLAFTNLFANHGPKDIQRLRSPDLEIDENPYKFTSGPEKSSTDLTGAVYGGPNPGNAWVTFVFKAEGGLAVAFGRAPDAAPAAGSTNDWAYTYNAGAAAPALQGEVKHPTGGGLGPFSNGGGTPYFNISGKNGTSLDFEHFMANPRSFKRYR
jgi:hypothetical protein